MGDYHGTNSMFLSDERNPFRSRTMSSRLHSARPPAVINPKIIITKPTSASEASIANFIADDGLESVVIRCHGCDEQINTKLTYIPNKVVQALACILCLGGCFLCSCIPYYMKNIKDVMHTCPNCERVLGTYHRYH